MTKHPLCTDLDSHFPHSFPFTTDKGTATVMCDGEKAPSLSDILITMEREIRSQAASIVNRDSTRKAHPTFGVTKTSLRLDAARLDGMVALYAVLTEQANFHSAPAAFQPEFAQPITTQAVENARRTVRSL